MIFNLAFCAGVFCQTATDSIYVDKHKADKQCAISYTFDVLNILELFIGNVDFNQVLEKLMVNSEIPGFLNKTSEQESFSKLAA